MKLTKTENSILEELEQQGLYIAQNSRSIDAANKILTNRTTINGKKIKVICHNTPYGLQMELTC